MRLDAGGGRDRKVGARWGQEGGEELTGGREGEDGHIY